MDQAQKLVRGLDPNARERWCAPERDGTWKPQSDGADGADPARDSAPVGAAGRVGAPALQKIKMDSCKNRLPSKIE